MKFVLSIVLVAAAVVMETGSAHADLGDQLFKLVPNDGAGGFGGAVAISGTTAIVGAPRDAEYGPDWGAAYLFDTTTGQQLMKLIPEDDELVEFAGISVGISGTTAIVGAKDGSECDKGAVYFFDATTGKQLFKLLGGYFFGHSVGISGNIAFIGGSSWDAYFQDCFSEGAFLFDATTGELLYQFGSQLRNDMFGFSVGISGNKCIVGAMMDYHNRKNGGSAYLYDTDTGQQLYMFPERGDTFGYIVAIGGTTCIVGDYGGTAFLFDNTTGQEITQLLTDDGGGIDKAGISGNTAIVSGGGGAYLFDTTAGQQIAKLQTDDGVDIGGPVAISGDIAIVAGGGAAYLFDVAGTISPLTSFNIGTGNLLEGAIPDLETSDDVYIHTQSGFGETAVNLHSMEMSILAEAPGHNPTVLELTIESHIDEPAGMAEVRMKNFNTREFDVVASYSIGNTDSIEVIPGLDASTYYNSNNGRMRVKIKHLVFVPFLAFTFESFIDQVEVEVY